MNNTKTIINTQNTLPEEPQKHFQALKHRISTLVAGVLLAWALTACGNNIPDETQNNGSLIYSWAELDINALWTSPTNLIPKLLNERLKLLYTQIVIDHPTQGDASTPITIYDKASSDPICTIMLKFDRETGVYKMTVLWYGKFNSIFFSYIPEKIYNDSQSPLYVWVINDFLSKIEKNR
jgi:hypothetical protein